MVCALGYGARGRGFESRRWYMLWYRFFLLRPPVYRAVNRYLAVERPPCKCNVRWSSKCNLGADATYACSHKVLSREWSGRYGKKKKNIVKRLEQLKKLERRYIKAMIIIITTSLAQLHLLTRFLTSNSLIRYFVELCCLDRAKMILRFFQYKNTYSSASTACIRFRLCIAASNGKI